MKAVFLDYATVGPGLDLSPLKTIFPALMIFDATAEEQVSERTRDAEFVFANKVRMTKERIQEASKLQFIL